MKPSKRKRHIDLKDLTEQNFLDLVADKKQDNRFYGWLHFHPLFDEWNSSDGANSEQNEMTGERLHSPDRYPKTTRGRGNSQNLGRVKSKNLLSGLTGEKKQPPKVEEDTFFEDLYAGINNMFEGMEDS